MEKDNFYSKKIESAMVTFYNHLNERDRRHFSAISTMQLPHGGKKYISSVFNINTRTIYEGKNQTRKGLKLENRFNVFLGRHLLNWPSL